ncbi:MAG: PLP-dependent aminotransferase family protein [Nitrospinaceae bacterium]|nr:PLP-dependent aminotransferase family protein [Nitrospinaceae bacterium]
MKKHTLSQLGARAEDSPISWLMKAALDRPELISLAAGFTDNATLPLKITREILDGILGSSSKGRSALQYGTTQGDLTLRRLTARRLYSLDFPEISPENPPVSSYSAGNIVVTNGSQQFLYLLSEALYDPGDLILVEDPTYFVFLGIAKSLGMHCRGIRMQADGIDIKHLEEQLEGLRKSGEIRRLKMVYLVSYFQNPTGRNTTLEKKKQALDLVRRYESHAGHPIFLLEDAAYRELRFSGAPVASMLSLDPHQERVIYTGTYSKSFATGVRVGFGVVPDSLLSTILRIKANHDFGSPNLLQKLMVEVLTGTQYESHLQAIQRRYLRKSRVMLSVMKKSFPASVHWDIPQGGLNAWVVLPRKWRTGLKSRIFKESLNQNVLYVPGNLCYAEDSGRRKPDHEMRISFGSASEPDIREGIRRLGRVFSKLQ